MSHLPAFSEYAAAFETTLQDDDWSRLGQYFCEDAVCAPGDGSEVQGREAVIAALKDSVERLERKTDARELVGEPGVSEAGDQVTLTFKIRYTRAGMPDLILDGVERLDYENGRIRRLEDTFTNAGEYLAWREQL